MEENKETQQIHEQEHSEENSIREGQINQEEKSSTVMEEKEHATKQTHEIGKTEEERVIPTFEEKERDGKETILGDKAVRAETSKKPKQSSRQNPKAKTTVPRPFSLATEKRILSRERRAPIDFASVNEKKVPKERCNSLDFKNSRPGLSKSVSLNHRNQSFNSARETHELRREKSTLATHKTRVGSQVATVRQNSITSASQSVSPVTKKGVPKERSLSVDLSSMIEKKVHKERLISTDSKNSRQPRLPKSVSLNHKALPSVNAEEDSNPRHEKTSEPTIKLSIKPPVKTVEHSEKKPGVKITHPRSPELGQGKKSVSRKENKGKTPSKMIASSARNTINKLLKNTRKVLKTSKVVARSAVVASS